MWLLYAFLSAICAALVAIFAKLGLKSIDSTLATTVRSVIMSLFLLAVAAALKKFSFASLDAFSAREWLMITLAGIAGALSWLFYFLAIQAGNVTPVVAIDRLSIAIVVLLAALFLGEPASLRVLLGTGLIIAGALMISL